MGGNVFDFCNDIPKNMIKLTVGDYKKEIKNLFPNCNFNCISLGSASKKEISGDIDLGLDQSLFYYLFDTWKVDQTEFQKLTEQYQKRSRTSTLEMNKQRAFLFLIAQYINTNSEIIKVNVKKTGMGNIFTCIKQHGTEDWVQVDLCIGNIDWLKFAYYSESYEGNIKGLHRTQLLVAMYTNISKIFSHVHGIKDKESNVIETRNPYHAIQILNESYYTNFNEKSISNYFKIIQSIEKLSSYDNIIDIYLSILDSTRCDIPDNLQDYWIKNKERLNLTGKFLPESSVLYEWCS
jgi:hypothetical protein